ncbi:diguanylate cyclase [Alteromonas sp. C1M14]|uniref:GGDEF domain-containing protein n=1 Tax=Alteromonas sp. C1M14 TaxID=2841567 RepID=UPI001C0980B7|nr:diguanylate cyclase [Alteromonas sp. C1M14]MBU2977118.1 diguanylate cyclase [Alteromonas sp. C1M14]
MSLSKYRVLIIDDDITTIRLIAEALSPDYDVIIATSAEDGLKQALVAQPYLILLDVLMPRINGFTLCKQLKSNAHTLNIPVIFVTALTEVDEQTKGFELGAVDYITKPIEVPLLRARVRTHTRLYQQTLQLESLAATDSLTGLANRRKFDDVMSIELGRCHRARNSLAFLMIDIDDFKAYNDHYGHGKGDDCLGLVSRILKQSARRATDLVCRLGGEEFGIVLTETDKEGALSMAEAILSAFQEQKISHESSQNGFLSVSIGATVVDMSLHSNIDVTVREIVDKADNALYLAKSKGRNRVEFVSVLPAAP